MSFREVSIQRAADADILASLQGLYPVSCGDSIRLLSRKRIMGLIEEGRHGGSPGDVSHLLKALEFNGEAVFRNSFSQMASRSVALRTSTMFRMLEVMSRTGESRDDLMRRLLAPLISDLLEDLAEDIDEEKRELLQLSLEDWKSKRIGQDEVEADDLAGSFEGIPSPPVLRIRLGRNDLPGELMKSSRYFLKNLFRLNNVHGMNEFYHPPEVIENYWEVVSPEQGVFHLEISPATKSITIGLYRTSRSFGLMRTENPDYYDMAEFLISEKRAPNIKGCRVEVHGATAADEIVLQEALSIDSMLVEDPLAAGAAATVPRPMSPEGLSAFRNTLMRLTGIRSEVRFPVNLQDPFCGDQDFSIIGFDIRLDPDVGRFIIDDVPVLEANLSGVGLAFASRLLGLSRQVYRDPPRFPQPDLDLLDAEVHALMAKAEREELTDDLAREIVAKITVLDYYESLARYSYALGEQLVQVLTGRQKVTFTIPRILLALLNAAIGPDDLEEMVLLALNDRRDGTR